MFVGQVGCGILGGNGVDGVWGGGDHVKPHPQKQPLPSSVAAKHIDRVTIPCVFHPRCSHTTNATSSTRLAKASEDANVSIPTLTNMQRGGWRSKQQQSRPPLE